MLLVGFELAIPSIRAAADPRLRPRGHSDRQLIFLWDTLQRLVLFTSKNARTEQVR